MNVLLIGSAGKYGAQLSLFFLCNKLKEQGINVQVVLPNHGETEELFKNSGIKCHIIKNGLMWYGEQSIVKKKFIWWIKIIINYIAELRLGKIIKEEKIDIVHINSIGVGVGAKSAIKQKKKLVWHIREFIPEGLSRYLYNEKKTYELVGKSDAIITISKAVYDRYQKLIKNNNFRVIYNGIETSIYAAPNRTILNDNIIRIVVPGRICYEKGQFTVLGALEYLKDISESLIVDFCGDGNGNDKELERLKMIVKRKGLEKLIIFSGYCERMEEKYKNADICVVSSKIEGFGRVNIEAMMAGCIVIGTNSGGTKELLASERGLLYEFADEKALADSIKWIINNRKKAKAIADSARKYALENFSAWKNAVGIYKLYEEIYQSEKV